MNLLYGQICKIEQRDGIPMATVSVGGARVQVSVLFLPEAKVGDVVLIESGVAISKVEQLNQEEP